MKRSVVIALVVALLAVSASAQGGSKSVVNVNANGPTDPVAAGYAFQIAVVLQVKAGYHINAQKPSEDYLIGTKLSFDPPSGVKLSKVSYPRAKMETFEFSETPLAVYDGSVELIATLKTDKDLEPGQLVVPGKVTFQACNDQSCLAPSTVEVSATVNIVEPEKKPTGAVTITGAPPDARVFIDGKNVGVTDRNGRLVVRDVETGRRNLKVEAASLPPFDRTITVDEQRSATVEVASTTTEAPAPVEAAPPPPPVEPVVAAAATPPPPTVETEPRRDWTIPFALIGLVVGAAVMGVFVVARKRSTTPPTPQAK
jgi:DsbC/DsbD-like thiol-disulfide interchange protein